MTKAVKHEYSANMRRALYEGFLEAAKAEGLTLTEYCAKMWKEDWKAAMNAFSKFLPRENTVTGKVEHDHHHTHAGVSETTQFIDSIIGGDETQAEETKH